MKRRTVIRKELRHSLELALYELPGQKLQIGRIIGVLGVHSRALLAPDTTAIDRGLGYSKVHRAFH